MRFVVILNEKAGKLGKHAPGASPEELGEGFARAGIEADIRVPKAEQINEFLQAAVAERPDAIIIGGGDGTVRCAAAALADTGVTLGVLPLGTLNHFAKDLQMPAKPAEAIAVLAAGVTREVDVGEVNGHVFINNCSLGAYAEAVRRRDRLREKRGLGKWWAMMRASFDEFRRLRRLRLRIKVERADAPSEALSEGMGPSAHRGGRSQTSGLGSVRSTSEKIATPIVVIANNRYSGHLFSQNLRPTLNAGELWLYTVHARQHLAILRMMLQSLFGRLDEADHLAAEAAREITIESDGTPVPIAADGEVLQLLPPFHFRTRPGALRVLAADPGDGERTAADGRQPAAHPSQRTLANAPTQVSGFRSRASR